jgi:ParB family transcriptional regulator, chromosome partitioning protein
MALDDKFASLTIFAVDPVEVDRDLGGRIGLYFPTKAEALAELIAHDGQNTPIVLRKTGNRAKMPWRLVAGLHRLEACALAGLECLAVEVTGDDDALMAIQASENMDRRELEPIERAMFVHSVAEAARKRVFAETGVENDKQLAAKAKAARVQYSDSERADADAEAAGINLISAYGWSEETADACGLSVPHLKRSLRIYRCIVADNRDLIDAFKDHPIAKNASNLAEICKLKVPALRRKVIETAISGPADLGLIFQMVGIATAPSIKTPYDKFSGQIMGGLHRLGTADWRRFCPVLVNELTPARRADLRAALDQIDSGDAA